METQNTALAGGWSTSPTAKEKSAVQRSVTELLDSLAPERVPKRGDAPQRRIEQHRTPTGCVLQAKTAAVSVSWFADNRGRTLGELHINVWDGVVSRGGSSHRKAAKAELVSELVLRPTIDSIDGRVWRADDGRDFDTPSVAAHCLALLEQQIGRSSESEQ
jgi:hypothetical protein